MEVIFVRSSTMVQNPGSWAITEKCNVHLDYTSGFNQFLLFSGFVCAFMECSFCHFRDYIFMLKLFGVDVDLLI